MKETGMDIVLDLYKSQGINFGEVNSGELGSKLIILEINEWENRLKKHPLLDAGWQPYSNDRREANAYWEKIADGWRDEVIKSTLEAKKRLGWKDGDAKQQKFSHYLVSGPYFVRAVRAKDLMGVAEFFDGIFAIRATGEHAIKNTCVTLYGMYKTSTKDMDLIQALCDAMVGSSATGIGTSTHLRKPADFIAVAEPTLKAKFPKLHAHLKACLAKSMAAYNK